MKKTDGRKIAEHRQQIIESQRCWYHVEIEFEDRVYGGLPLDVERIRKWCESRQFGAEVEERLLTLARPEEQTKRLTEAALELEIEESLVANATGFAWTPEVGCCLTDLQIKAMLKTACSRLGYYQQRRALGAKGVIAECTRVWPKLIPLGHDVPSGLEVVRGRVTTPKGQASIISYKFYIGQDGLHESQPVRAEFVIETLQKSPLSGDDILSALILGETIGLGSLRSRERGKFRVISFSEMAMDEFNEWYSAYADKDLPPALRLEPSELQVDAATG